MLGEGMGGWRWMWMGGWGIPLASIAGSGCPSLSRGGWEGREAATGVAIVSDSLSLRLHPHSDCGSMMAARSDAVVASTCIWSKSKIDCVQTPCLMFSVLLLSRLMKNHHQESINPDLTPLYSTAMFRGAKNS